jgi:CubicO group peptidase (beta-lactamase class C family)
MKVVGYILFFVLLLSGCKEEINPQSLRDRIDEIVNPSLYFGTHTGLAVGIISKNEKSVFCYGTANLHNRTRVDESTIFEIGSITKTFTGILLQHIINEGLVQLDDPLGDYVDLKIPDYNGEKITFRHVVTHTSGLPKFFDIHHIPQIFYFPPGQGYSYSNGTFMLLGYALEKISGKSYDELITEVITNNLEMPDTRTQYGLSDIQNRKKAVSYDMNQQIKEWYDQRYVGAGGLRSTITDILNYMEANIDPRSEFYKNFGSCQDVLYTKEDGSGIGIAWMTEIRKDQEWIGHTGDTWQSSTFHFNKNEGIGVVVLSNSINSDRTRSIQDEIIELLVQ